MNKSSNKAGLWCNSSVCLCVGVFFLKMYSGKTAECINMLFPVVCGVGLGVGVVVDWHEAGRQTVTSY